MKKPKPALDPSRVLRATRPGDARPAGAPPEARLKVLAALNTPRLDDPTRVRLERAGLSVDRVIGNKVIGTAAPADLDAVRADPAVAEVETSMPLRPHAP